MQIKTTMISPIRMAAIEKKILKKITRVHKAVEKFESLYTIDRNVK